MLCHNKVMEKVCESKRHRVTGRWRELHSVAFHNFYSYIVRAMK